MLGSNDSPKVKSLSLALGVFIGIIPIWGFQTAVALFLAVTFRLNKILTFAASNISIPPMIPVIVITALKIGSLVLNKPIIDTDLSTVANFKNHLTEYVVGSLILATIAAILVGIISFVLLNIFQKRQKTNG